MYEKFHEMACITLEGIQATLKKAYDGKTNLKGHFYMNDESGLIEKNYIGIDFVFTPFSEVILNVPYVDGTHIPLYAVPLLQNFNTPKVAIFDKHSTLRVLTKNIPHQNGIIDMFVLKKSLVTEDGYHWFKSIVSISQIRYLK